MEERAPPKGFGAYLVQLGRTILFPLVWLQAFRIAGDKRDVDPRGPLKVGVAVVASLAVTGALVLFLWDFHEDAERAMYDGFETRIARAAHDAGPGGYQEAAEAVSASVAMMSGAAERMAGIAGADDVAGRAAAQRAAAQRMEDNASQVGVTPQQLAAAEGVVARADAADLTADEIQTAAGVQAAPERFPNATRQEADATMQRAQENNLTADSLRDAEALLERARPFSLSAANLTQAQRILGLDPDGAAAAVDLLAAHQSYNATVQPLLGEDGVSARLAGRDVEAQAAQIRADLDALEDHMQRMNASLERIDAAQAARWGRMHATALAAAREGLDDAEALAPNHRLVLDLQEDVAGQDDAAVQAALDEAGGAGTPLEVEEAAAAFAMKDDAQADMDRVFLWVIWPSVVGVFFAPLVFALGSILRNDWEASETVGFKPYPGKAGGWFLLMGGFGVPALFFAAWMFKDLQARAIERQIAL